MVDIKKLINPGVDGAVHLDSPFVLQDTVIGQSVRATACGNGYRMGMMSNSNPEKIFEEGTEDWYNLDEIGYGKQLSHYNGVGTNPHHALIVDKSLTSKQ